jgi:hypothetical protein
MDQLCRTWCPFAPFCKIPVRFFTLPGKSVLMRKEENNDALDNGGDPQNDGNNQ